jgi:tetratricopeptide (TPR) repeat protein
VRRTLLSPPLRSRFGRDAIPLAGAVAILWTVHPLQTQSVTYIVQRAESLMGLFYLLTFYAFIRSTEQPGATAWAALSILACLLGMATKEVMVTAPVLVFLYDRTFVAGSFRAAWNARRLYYSGLAATWLLLAGVVWSAGTRDGTALKSAYISWFDYVDMQPVALAQYLWLSVWPAHLIFDYGTYQLHRPWIEAGAAFLFSLLGAAAVWALWRRSAMGFLGAWFFGILAPTSSVVIASPETISEHRMYLSLAAVTAFVVLGLYATMRRFSFPLLAAAVIVLVVLTYQRNKIYGDSFSVWSEAVAKNPANVNAMIHFADALTYSGHPDEALPIYRRALQINPASSGGHTALGVALFQTGRVPEAMTELQQGARLAPRKPQPHFNYGFALARTGHIPEAIAQYREALRYNPYFLPALEKLAQLEAATK